MPVVGRMCPCGGDDVPVVGMMCLCGGDDVPVVGDDVPVWWG